MLPIKSCLEGKSGTNLAMSLTILLLQKLVEISTAGTLRLALVAGKRLISETLPTRSSPVEKSGTNLVMKPNNHTNLNTEWISIFKNTEACPGCAGLVDVTDVAHKVVSGGREWHRSCFDASRKEQATKRNDINARNMEYCPSCSKPVGDVAAEKVVFSGKEWHKTCYENFKGESATAQRDVSSWNRESCPGCHQAIQGNQESIVKAGKAWHKSCLKTDDSAPQRWDVHSKNVEVCPGCQSEVVSGSDFVIVAGKQWHRSPCYTNLKT